MLDFQTVGRRVERSLAKYVMRHGNFVRDEFNLYPHPEKKPDHAILVLSYYIGDLNAGHIEISKSQQMAQMTFELNCESQKTLDSSLDIIKAWYALRPKVETQSLMR